MGKEYEGDTSFPALDYAQWTELSKEDYARGEEYEYPFSFITLERKR